MKRRHWVAIIGITLLLATGCGTADARPRADGGKSSTVPNAQSSPVVGEQGPVGRRVADFTLPDYAGKQHKLSDYAESKVVVLAFLGTECPLARLYGPRLAELHARYGPQGVTFLGVNSNQQDTLMEIAAYARKHKVDFPILKDAGNKLADALGAQRTPEVFVLDDQRVVRYWGRIDDQYGIGYVRKEPKRHDLAEALDELLAGKRVSQSVQNSVGCFIGRVSTAKSQGDVTYSKHIAPILQHRCVECHRPGEIGPFALTSYAEAAAWAATIAEVIREERMPPWHASPRYGKFANDRRMSDEEKSLIYRWVETGTPEGNPADLPPPRTFTAGWNLPRDPDLVVPMANEPVDVPATGEVKYRYYRVDPGLKEDKWIEAAELLPGNPSVVHHILVFARPPGRIGTLGEGGLRGFLVGYVPGLRPQPLPKGMAKRIPAGSHFIFQMHYTPNGSPQKDLSKLGLVFADPKTITHEVKTTSAVQRFLAIPPGAADHAVTATTLQRLPDALLLGFMPHMHVRGKSFRYELLKPDGSSEILLDVPRYDFNWQTSYRLAEPMPIPVGSRMKCYASYDNSEANPNNPDPTKTVRWGDQTWEEMMIGYFDLAVPLGTKLPDDEEEAAAERQAEESRPAEQRAREVVKRYDANGDGKVQRDEVPAAILATFDRIDRDKDRVVTLEELTRAIEALTRRAVP